MDKEQVLSEQQLIIINQDCSFFIPDGTTVISKEGTVILRYDEDLDCYNIYNKEALDKKMSWFVCLRMMAKTTEEKRNWEMNFYKFCKSILMECKIDSNRLIKLDSLFEPGEEIFVTEDNDHLILKSKNRKK